MCFHPQSFHILDVLNLFCSCVAAWVCIFAHFLISEHHLEQRLEQKNPTKVPISLLILGSFVACYIFYYWPWRRIPRLSELFGKCLDWNNRKSVILGCRRYVGGLPYTVNTCCRRPGAFPDCFGQSGCLQKCCHHWRHHLLLFKNASTISSFKRRPINQFKGNHRDFKYFDPQSDAPGRC